MSYIHQKRSYNNNYSREKRLRKNGSFVVVVLDFRSTAWVETTKENNLSLVIHNVD